MYTSEAGPVSTTAWINIIRKPYRFDGAASSIRLRAHLAQLRSFSGVPSSEATC